MSWKSCCKILLVGFNILFTILGAVVLGIGVFVKFDKKDLTAGLARVTDAKDLEGVDVPSLLESAAYALMAVGGFIFLVGFLGCCGAWKEWRLFLALYAVIVGVVLVAQIAAVVLVVLYKNKVDDFLKEFLHNTINNSFKDGVKYDGKDLKLPSDALTMSWALAQFELECCGAENYTDYQSSTSWDNLYTVDISGYKANITAKVPISCCSVENPTDFPDNLGSLKFTNITECLQNPSPANTNTKGCYQGVKDMIMNYVTVCAAIAGAIAFFEVVVIVLACCMCRLIGKEGKEV